MLSQLKAIKTLGWRTILRAGQLKRFGRETIRGFYTTRVIIALRNIGLFDAFAAQSRVDLERFAADRELDARILRTLCDYLYALKILNRNGDHYWLDSTGQQTIPPLSGTFDIVYAYEDLFYHLEDLLSQEKSYGVEITRRAEFVAKGSGSVGKLVAFPMLREVLLRNKFKTVLDLGCGDATFLIDLCRQNPAFTGYGLDISPEGIAAGQQQVAQNQLQDRVHLFVDDIFNIDQLTKPPQAIEAATCLRAP